MERPLLNTSSDRLNAIDSFSGALFGNSYKIIPLDESQELGDDVFPFNPSEYHIIIKKKMFETLIPSSITPTILFTKKIQKI